MLCLTAQELCEPPETGEEGDGDVPRTALFGHGTMPVILGQVQIGKIWAECTACFNEVERGTVHNASAHLAACVLMTP